MNWGTTLAGMWQRVVLAGIALVAGFVGTVDADVLQPPDAAAINTLESALAQRSDIRAEDQSQLRDILRKQMTPGRKGLSLSEMSAKRRTRLAEEITHTVQSFPSGQFDTPLQRQTKLKSYSIVLQALFESPVYASESTPELKNQLATITDWIVNDVARCYPDVVGSVVPEQLRALVQNRFDGLAEDDMVPVFKRALPRDDFLSLLEALRAEAKAIVPFGLQANGHFTNNWESMAAPARKEYLRDKAAGLVSAMFSQYSRCLHVVQARYAQAYLATAEQPISLMGEQDMAAWREQVKATRDEFESIRKREDERNRAEIERDIRHTNLMVQVAPYVVSQKEQDAAVASLRADGADSATRAAVTTTAGVQPVKEKGETSTPGATSVAVSTRTVPLGLGAMTGAGAAVSVVGLMYWFGYRARQKEAKP